jgi:O-antigen/teichoic acid export membrane protein
MSTELPQRPPQIPPSSGPSFWQGVFWNVASFILMGVSGILLNVMIAQAYPAAILGVFNQIFALYIFASQLAVFGIHYSILHHNAILVEQDAQSAAESASSALLLVGLISLAVTLGVGLLRDAIGSALQSPGISDGLLVILPGLLLFPLNKVLLSLLNSQRRMKAYAIANASRYLMLVAALCLLISIGVEGKLLTLSFSIAELLLFSGLLWSNRSSLTRINRQAFAYWSGNHLGFGQRGMLAGLLAELNTRIDVLLLGYFMTDASVGQYSFIAILAEGVLQLLSVLRVNYDPILARLYAERDIPELKRLITKGRKLAYAAMTVCGLLSIALYPIAIHILGFSQVYLQAHLLFSILLIGIMLSAGFVPFGGLLQQAGRPGSQSLFIFGLALLNLIGNLLLIPVMGVMGAAIATAFAQAMFGAWLAVLVRQRLGFWI